MLPFKGWLYAFENQDEALNIVMKHAKAAHTGTNKAHQRWMLARMKDLIIPDGDTSNLGKLNLADYALVGDILKDFRLIDRAATIRRLLPGAKIVVKPHSSIGLKITVLVLCGASLVFALALAYSYSYSRRIILEEAEKERPGASLCLLHGR